MSREFTLAHLRKLKAIIEEQQIKPILIDGVEYIDMEKILRSRTPLKFKGGKQHCNDN